MKIPRKNLIISADDFGISQLANKNILLLAQAGKLDRVAVMTNGKFSSEEIEALKKTGVKLDIHLDPDSEISNKRKLKAGALSRGFIFVFKFISGQVGPSAHQKHWQKQIDKFHKIFNQYPDGINSHQHVHFFSPYFKVVLQIAATNHIPFIRFGKRRLLVGRNLIYPILQIWHWVNSLCFSFAKIDSSDYMISLDWIKNIPQFLENIPEGKTEIVCHPERKEEFEIIKKYF